LRETGREISSGAATARFRRAGIAPSGSFTDEHGADSALGLAGASP